MVLAFLLFVCSVLTSEKWGREWPWSVSPEAEPEAGVLGKRCTEGVLSGEISQRAREERSWGKGLRKGRDSHRELWSIKATTELSHLDVGQAYWPALPPYQSVIGCELP